MTTWNYRVIASDYGDESEWAIHEVYYDDEGEIISWSEHPIPVAASSLEGLKDELLLFQAALAKPHLSPRWLGLEEMRPQDTALQELTDQAQELGLYDLPGIWDKSAVLGGQCS